VGSVEQGVCDLAECSIGLGPLPFGVLLTAASTRAPSAKASRTPSAICGRTVRDGLCGQQLRMIGGLNFEEPSSGDKAARRLHLTLARVSQ
jgi:hypothetical protein